MNYFSGKISGKWTLKAGVWESCFGNDNRKAGRISNRVFFLPKNVHYCQYRQKCFFSMFKKWKIESAVTTRPREWSWAKDTMKSKKSTGSKIIFFKTAGLLSNLHKFAETTYSSYICEMKHWVLTYNNCFYLAWRGTWKWFGIKIRILVKSLFDFYIFVTDGTKKEIAKIQRGTC